MFQRQKTNSSLHECNAAFTLKGFDNQRILTFMKTDFQVLKLIFHA